jgi:hypothetical protein
MLSVVMPRVMISVVMLNVVAPNIWLSSIGKRPQACNKKIIMAVINSEA